MVIASYAAPRLALGAPLAALVTLALAMLMQSLIALREQPPQPRRSTPVVTITSQKADTEATVRERPTPPVEVVSPPRPVITTEGETEPKPGLGAGPGPAPVPPVGPGEIDVTFRAPPRLLTYSGAAYPQRMYPREGSCVVAFDVEASGATSNIRTRSCTDGGFSSAAEQAVRRFRYQPAQGEDGPVATRGMSVQLDFRAE